jgi:hypothetical protein
LERRRRFSSIAIPQMHRQIPVNTADQTVLDGAETLGTAAVVQEQIVGAASLSR